ncbi:MAG: TIGR02300 family protein [Hyphomicrobium sp.]|nr:TIGR02300 family protein [Hyphomicrobium sp.]
MATKQARGIKRSCQSCDERFYDLEKTPILCPHCGAKYVIASSPAALAALQAEEKAARNRVKKAPVAEEVDGELPVVEGEEALADVEGDEAVADADETFLEEEEEEGGDMANIIGGPAGEGEEEV